MYIIYWYRTLVIASLTLRISPQGLILSRIRRQETNGGASTDPAAPTPAPGASAPDPGVSTPSPEASPANLGSGSQAATLAPRGPTSGASVPAPAPEGPGASTPAPAPALAPAPAPGGPSNTIGNAVIPPKKGRTKGWAYEAGLGRCNLPRPQQGKWVHDLKNPGKRKKCNRAINNREEKQG